jgi:hypothetical protein
MSEPRITIVTVTTASQTPDELIAAAYPSGVIPDTALLDTTRLISFVPFAAGIFSATRTAATVNDVPLGMNTLTLEARRREISGDRGIEFIAASSIKMAIIESSSADVSPLSGQYSGSGSDGSSALTFSTVVITESAAGIADLGVGASGEVVRLHKLVLTMRAQGTVTIGYDDDGAATNAVALTGAISLGAGGGILDDFGTDPREALTTVADKHLTITLGTAGGDGWAVISKGPA